MTDTAVAFHRILSLDHFDQLWAIFANELDQSWNLPSHKERHDLFFVLSGPSCHTGGMSIVGALRRDMQAIQQCKALFKHEGTSLSIMEHWSTALLCELSCQKEWSNFFCLLQDAMPNLGDDLNISQRKFTSTYISSLLGVSTRRKLVSREALAGTIATNKELVSLMQNSWSESLASIDWVEIFESTTALIPRLQTSMLTTKVGPDDHCALLLAHTQVTFRRCFC